MSRRSTNAASAYSAINRRPLDLGTAECGSIVFSLNRNTFYYPTGPPLTSFNSPHTLDDREYTCF